MLFMFDAHVAAQRQHRTQTHVRMRECVHGAGAGLHPACQVVEGAADVDRFICSAAAVQHVSEASLEFRLALESFIQPNTAQKSNIARHKPSVATRNRPNTTHLNTRHEFLQAHFPPLQARTPLVSKMGQVVGVIPDIATVAGKQMKTEVRRKSALYARSNVVPYVHVSTSNTRLPRVWTKPESRDVSRTMFPESAVTFHGNGVNKSDAYMVPSNGEKSHLKMKDPILSSPPAKCMLSSNDTELKWEDFHSWNPACSYDVFLRCWSWLKDQYMRVPELRPHYCNLQSFLLDDSDSDELL